MRQLTLPSSGRAAGVTAVACLSAAALALSGCTSAGSGDGGGDRKARAEATAEATGEPVLTTDAAQQVVDHYVDVNNRANARQDAELLGTVEAGPVHERSTAEYRQFATRSPKEKDEYAGAFRYEDLTFHIPSGGDWFAATARVADDGQRRILVFEKSGGGAGGKDTWKMTGVVHLDEKVPEIASGSRGAAATAEPDAASGSLTPRQVTAAVADLYATGGKKTGGKLARTKSVQRALKIHRERDRALGKLGVRKTFVPARPEPPRVHALRTSDGGTLPVVPLAHTVRTTATRPGRSVTPSSREAVYDPDPRRTVTDTHVGQAAAYLPPTGRPRVLGTDYAMTDSR